MKVLLYKKHYLVLAAFNQLFWGFMVWSFHLFIQICSTIELLNIFQEAKILRRQIWKIKKKWIKKLKRFFLLRVYLNWTKILFSKLLKLMNLKKKIKNLKISLKRKINIMKWNFWSLKNRFLIKSKIDIIIYL